MKNFTEIQDENFVFEISQAWAQLGQEERVLSPEGSKSKLKGSSPSHSKFTGLFCIPMLLSVGTIKYREPAENEVEWIHACHSLASAPWGIPFSEMFHTTLRGKIAVCSSVLVGKGLLFLLFHRKKPSEIKYHCFVALHSKLYSLTRILSLQKRRA